MCITFACVCEYILIHMYIRPIQAYNYHLPTYYGYFFTCVPYRGNKRHLTLNCGLWSHYAPYLLVSSTSIRAWVDIYHCALRTREITVLFLTISVFLGNFSIWWLYSSIFGFVCLYNRQFACSIQAIITQTGLTRHRHKPMYRWLCHLPKASFVLVF